MSLLLGAATGTAQPTSQRHEGVQLDSNTVSGDPRFGIGLQVAPLTGISFRFDVATHLGIQIAVLPTFPDDVEKGIYGARVLYSFVDRPTYRLSVTAGVTILHRYRLLPFVSGSSPETKLTFDQIYSTTFHAESHFGPSVAMSAEIGLGYRNLGVERDYGFLPFEPSGMIGVFGFGVHYFLGRRQSDD